MIAVSSELVVVGIYVTLVLAYALATTWRKIMLFRDHGIRRDNRRHIHKIDNNYGLFRRHNLGKKALLHSWLFGIALLVINTFIYASNLLKWSWNPAATMAAQTAVIALAAVYVVTYYTKQGSLLTNMRRVKVFFGPLVIAAGLTQFLNTFANGAISIVRMF